jgi:hypothetical protein
MGCILGLSFSRIGCNGPPIEAESRVYSNGRELSEEDDSISHTSRSASQRPRCCAMATSERRRFVGSYQWGEAPPKVRLISLDALFVSLAMGNIGSRPTRDCSKLNRNDNKCSGRFELVTIPWMNAATAWASDLCCDAHATTDNGMLRPCSCHQRMMLGRA